MKRDEEHSPDDAIPGDGSHEGTAPGGPFSSMPNGGARTGTEAGAAPATPDPTPATAPGAGPVVPAMSLGEAKLDRTWKVSGVVANLTVAATLAIAALAYSSDREDAVIAAVERQDRERRTAALSYVTRFQTGEVLEARNEVYAAFLAFGPDQIPEVGITDEVRLALVDGMIRSRPDPLAMRMSLVNIVDFYDGVEACRESDLCDGALLDASLASYAVRFQCFFGEYVGETRRALRVPGFGRGLEAIVEREGGCA